jgi:hypothetical protein
MALPSGHGLLIIERILRDRDSIWRQVVDERGLKELTTQMLASSAASLACYGAVLGASSGFAQALSSAIKLPLLFLATLAICLPTLYLFNLLFGARLSVMQAVVLIMVSITVTSVLTLAFAPISLFFLISAHSYLFFKLLNVCILVLAAVIGLRFLTAGMAILNADQERRANEIAALAAQMDQGTAEPEPQLALVGAPTGDAGGNGSTGAAQAALPPTSVQAVPAQPAPDPASHQPVAGRVTAASNTQRPASMTLLYIWIALFGFVGTQLGWTLRPFFGSPGKPFAIFREIDGTFYGDIFSTIGRLLGG